MIARIIKPYNAPNIIPMYSLILIAFEGTVFWIRILIVTKIIDHFSANEGNDYLNQRKK